VRIPLDYYRILGLPIQATAEQLEQAHRDRALQLPRREYSDAAITARKQLLDEAYAILSNPEQRQAYDAGFLAKTYELESGAGATTDDAGSRSIVAESPPDYYAPSIEIQEHQFIGALLILQELGEYELVLKLGRPYLSSGKASLRHGRFGDPNIVFPDIVLTIALACLELGREQWQQGQYENAAEALETGQDLLLREGLFAGVRGEIQSDLFKLRPYRILELLALPEENFAERQKGLQLLQDMLQERNGIDGTGNDQSGLNIDDFLRFIQQLRGYLTAAEQQSLFETEANRPSAVATYLAVYALLGRGFAERQPSLVRRAKLMLMRLGTRQDVHLEQSVCALLLGQTEEASRALELSQEYEPLAFIREHSQGSPDLLPGLCLYAERWLQDEVFPHFRDLARRQSSLKDYFADEQVQSYLEALPTEAASQNEWTVSSTPKVAHERSAPRAPATSEPLAGMRIPSVGATSPSPQLTDREAQSLREQVYTAAARSQSTWGNSSYAGASHWENGRTTENTYRSTSRSATATLSSGGNSSNSTLPTAERVSPFPSSIESRDTSQRSVKPPDSLRQPPIEEKREGADDGQSSTGVSDIHSRRTYSSNPKVQQKSGLSSGVVLILLGLGLIAAGLLGFLVMRRLSTKPLLQGEQPMVRLDRPVVEVPQPSPSASGVVAVAELTDTSAQQVIQNWLSAKAAAMGPEHSIDNLEQALSGTALAQWQKRAEEAQRDNWHWQYQHSLLKVDSVKISDVDPNQAKVEAEVSEDAQFFEGGQLKQDLSYNETIRVQYDLIRQDGQWKIQAMTVLS
jgi:curved DNA-binding protein CbpA